MSCVTLSAMKYWIQHTLLAVTLCMIGGAAMAATVPRVTVEGAGDDLRSNILSHLRVTGEPCDTSMARLLRLMPQVRNNIRTAVEALGYYHSSFITRFIQNEACWGLEIQVTPGEPVRIGEVEIRILGGAGTRAIFSSELDRHNLVTGNRLNHGEYERVKSSLSALAVENGFFSARFTQSSIRLDLVENRADILLVFDPGERFTFGAIQLESGGRLSDEFLRGLVPFDPGDPYSASALMQLRRNLDDSQYFRQITISPDLARADGRAVPVSVDLMLRPRRAYSGGLGFTTDTGPRARVSYEDRYLNRGGHKLRSDGSVSPVRSGINVGYGLPLRNPARESLNFSAGYVTEDTDTFESDRIKLEASYRNESPGGWMRNAFVDYQRDDFVLNEDAGISALTIVGFNLSKTQADDLINPRRGWKLFGEATTAADFILSDNSFVQLHGNAKRIFSLGDRSRLLTRLEAGFTWIDRTRDLPASLRFFAGGDQSLRGFKYQTLGPTNEEGDVMGGRHLLLGGVEYDFRFRDSWRLAVFYDGGNAFADVGDFEWKSGIGVGIRWLSPIGPIRADIAHGFESDNAVRLHITMGPDL